MSILLVKPKKETILKKKSKPYYELIIHYMIGDSNGYTTEEADISVDNPFLERFCKILKKLKNPKHRWGFGLDIESIESNYKEKHITEDDKNFMICMMTNDPSNYDEDLKDYLKSEKEEEFANDFVKICRSESEYSFLTYQGFELTYVDENRKRHATKIK